MISSISTTTLQEFATGSADNALLTVTCNAPTSNGYSVVDWITFGYTNLTAGNSAQLTLRSANSSVWTHAMVAADTSTYHFEFPGGLPCLKGQTTSFLMLAGGAAGDIAKACIGYRRTPMLPDTTALPTISFHSPTTDNTAATKTITGVSGKRHVLNWISCSYDDTPDAASTLTVEVPSGTTIYQANIATAGIHHMTFPRGLFGAEGEDLVVTLSASSDDKGKISFSYR